MPVTPDLQITGGAFRDAAGTVLDSGYLLFELSHDENFPTGPAQVVAGLKFRVTLNSSGSVPASPAVMIYSNANLLPSGSFYIVRAFKSDGTEAWASPQTFVFAATPNPLDLGTLVPVNPPGSGLSSGTSALLLQTNEINNGSQSLLDLHAGTNITLTDNGTGRVTINSSSTLLKTNNVNNTNQAILNLTNGSNVSITDAGGGSVSIAASFSPTTVTTGDFFFPGTYTGQAYGSGGNFPNSANEIQFWPFVLQASRTISKISLQMTGGNPGSATTGIYDITGVTKLVDAGANAFNTDSISVPGVQTATITPVTLPAGAYLWAVSSTINTPTVTLDFTMSSGSLTAAFGLINASSIRIGTATNVLVGGALPSSLGTLVASNVTVMPAIIFSN